MRQWSIGVFRLRVSGAVVVRKWREPQSYPQRGMIAEIAVTISRISMERPSAFAAITVGAQIDGRGQKPMDQIAVGAVGAGREGL